MAIKSSFERTNTAAQPEQHTDSADTLATMLENREMYQITGSDQITEKDMERYAESARETNEALPKIISRMLTEVSRDHFIWAGLNLLTPFIDQISEPEQGDIRKRLAVAIQNQLDSTGSLYQNTKSLENMGYCPEPEQEVIRNKVLRIIETNLKPAEGYDLQATTNMIRYAPENEQARLIMEALDIDEICDHVKKYLIKTLPDSQKQIIFGAKPELIEPMSITKPEEEEEPLSPEEREAWIARHEKIQKFNLENGILQEIAEKTPLYAYVGQNPFFRKAFAKTGSELTLLDLVPGQPESSLKERLVIRHLNFSHYLLWKRAFESVDLWKQQGFDYVPIEPIVTTRKPPLEDIDDMTIDVYTKVIKGPSIATWLQHHGLFVEEILTQTEKILNGLNILNIEHGDDHVGNFVLKFHSDSDGNVDLSKPPRVYIIDFDQARQKTN